MHALLITFSSSVELAELVEPFSEYATALAQVPGLVSKTWIASEDSLGGFHLFETSVAADAYLAGPMLAEVRADPAFSDFRVVRYDVVEQLSAITNGLGGARPVAA